MKNGEAAPVRYRFVRWRGKSVHAVTAMLAVTLSLSLSGRARAAVPGDNDFADRAVQQVYQPAAVRFSRTTAELLEAAENSCETRSPEALDSLLAAHERAVAAFSLLELYRTGPLLEDNRQNRLFYWPDKRRVGERQMRALLADAAAPSLTADDIADKSVALQGFPALERLLHGERTPLHFSEGSETPDCQVAMAIIGNIDAMAKAIEKGWQDEAPHVMSMRSPASDSEFYRTEEEVLRGLVTQILVGADVIEDRKLSTLSGEQADIRTAPLWRSGLGLLMIRGNLESLRALTIDTGLAEASGLENELAFEFRSADGMLQQLQALPALTDDSGDFTAEAESLLRAVMAVVGGIRYTLNDRFVATLGISPGFNSEDGD
ncbi:imelysin family protein [Granulosicoccus sp. 3-233]|uniref:imelysin family protein n=1 Tax=Granulosicoccus sp. 3-233 TaxID=3417969 RepID=UPI003D342FA9